MVTLTVNGKKMQVEADSDTPCCGCCATI